MRYGGDEFLCVMPDIFPVEVGARLDRAIHALATGGGSVTYGLADLGTEDTAATLIARADAALFGKRQHPRDHA